MGTRNRGRALWRAISSFWQIEQLENRLLHSGTPLITGNNPIRAGIAINCGICQATSRLPLRQNGCNFSMPRRRPPRRNQCASIWSGTGRSAIMTECK